MNRENATKAVNELLTKRIGIDKFNALPEYSISMPTGPKEGFMWKRNLIIDTCGGSPVWCMARANKSFTNPELMQIIWFRPIIEVKETPSDDHKF